MKWIEGHFQIPKTSFNIVLQLAKYQSTKKLIPISFKILWTQGITTTRLEDLETTARSENLYKIRRSLDHYKIITYNFPRIKIPNSPNRNGIIYLAFSLTSRHPVADYTPRKLYFHFFSHWMGHDRGDSFPFHFEPNGTPF